MGTTPGRMDAMGWLVCLFQQSCPFSQSQLASRVRAGCRELVASCDAASPVAWVLAFLSCRCPSIPSKLHGALMGRSRVTEACVPQEHEPMPGWAGASHGPCMPCPCHGHYQELVFAPAAPGTGRSCGWWDPLG